MSTNDRGCLRQFATFVPTGSRSATMPLGAFTEDTAEQFFASLRQRERANSTRNKFVQAVTAAFRWATKKGYLARNPIEDAEFLTREKHAKRDRRLEPDLLTTRGRSSETGRNGVCSPSPSLSCSA